MAQLSLGAAPVGSARPGSNTEQEDKAHQFFWRTVTRGVQGALGSHLMFVALFYSLGAHLLAAFNIVSVLTYCVCLWLLRQRRNRVALMLALSEIVAHAVIAVRALGWDSGFHYYILLLIPIICAGGGRRGTRVAIAALTSASYMLLDAYMRNHTPLSPVNQVALDIMRYFNIVVTCSFFGALAYLYLRAVSEAQQQLKTMATTDTLTGLFNRREIIKVAELQEQRFHQARRPFCIVMADVDNFKGINDRLGHDGGDYVLRLVSRRLCETLRKGDSVARWGGEEFLVVLPDTSLNEASIVAEHLRSAVAEAKAEFNGESFGVTMTFGVSEYRDNSVIDACIARADQALYAGKRAGKNRIQQATWSASQLVNSPNGPGRIATAA